jgi:outer membrane protein OmpA-like peptidoglycan-associated protein
MYQHSVTHSRFFLLLLAILLVVKLYGQQPNTDKKTYKLWQQALSFYQTNQPAEALTLLEKALKRDAHYLDAYLLMADLCFDLGHNERGLEALKQAIATGKAPADVYLTRAMLYRRLNQYDKSLQDCRQFIALSQNESKKMKAQELLQALSSAKYLVDHSVPFKPINMAAAVNSAYDEYWPSFSINDSVLVFTRLLPTTTGKQEDFYWSELRPHGWLPASPLGETMNTPGNEGAQALSADGLTMVFTACNRPNGAGSCDLYISHKIGDLWSLPELIAAPINTNDWESQPSLSADGRTLFFASSRPGGYGGLDIWVSYLRNDGTWIQPVNLGDSVNTPSNESAPFIHADAQTLYFASDGWPGMGKSDFYISRWLGKKWSQAQNLGYPINTIGEERGLSVNREGWLAYLASARTGGYGGLDIYSFELPQAHRPNPVSYVRGYVYDITTNFPLYANAHLSAIDSSLVQKTSTDTQGNFLVCMPARKRYALNVTADGYLPYSVFFDLDTTTTIDHPHILRVPMQRNQKGNSFILNNIFFELDSYQLKPESLTELKLLLDILQQSPTLRIEISGHTDNSGTDTHNKTLSKQRAEEVKNYLINNGIKASRLETQGYGPDKSIAPNETPEGRARNRRTEVKIL